MIGVSTAPVPGRRGRIRGVEGPFGRLALAHVFSVGGDALVAMALAGSLFFSVDPSGARWRIFLYLIFTMAPFAVVGPLIGPAMDRAKGGRRKLLVGAAVGRAVMAVLMVSSAANDSLLLFPEAFAMLILAKTHQVAKAAIVPTVVDGDAELVEANSKLQLLSGLAGFAAGVPGLIALLIGPGAVMVLAVLVFVVAIVLCLRVPATTVASEPAGPAEVAELRSGAVVSAGSAMATLRGLVGFVTFVMAFALRGGDRITRSGEVMGRLAYGELDGEALLSDLAPAGSPPAWHFGVILVMAVAGGLAGAALAPLLRRGAHEEMLLLGCTGLAALSGAGGMVLGGLPGQALLTFGIAVSATAAKQAFDAVVQRDAPDANRGRIFAGFESRFQVAWVFGAVVPVLVPMPTQLGGLVVACFAVAAGVFFLMGMRAVQRGTPPPRLPGVRQVHDRLRAGIRQRRSAGSDGPSSGGPPRPPVPPPPPDGAR